MGWLVGTEQFPLSTRPPDCAGLQGMENEQGVQRAVGGYLQGNRSSQTMAAAGLGGFLANSQNSTIFKMEDIFQRRPTYSESLIFQCFLCLGKWEGYLKNMLPHALYTCLV